MAKRPCCSGPGGTVFGIVVCAGAAAVHYAQGHNALALGWIWVTVLLSVALVAELTHRAEHNGQMMPTYRVEREPSRRDLADLDLDDYGDPDGLEPVGDRR